MVTHLQWLCKLKRYLCYICRSTFQVRLGRIQWQASGGVVVTAAQRIGHPNYNPSTLANDIALLRLPNNVPFTSKYPSPVSTCVVVCVSLAKCDQCSTLWLLHVLRLDIHMIGSVTHIDKLIITRGGQQMGPHCQQWWEGCFS